MNTLDTSKLNYKIFNKQNYIFNVRLYDEVDPTNELYLNPLAITRLILIDDLHHWPFKGELVYENPHNIIEREILEPPEGAESPPTKTPYKFRNDGKDLLHITIRLAENTDSLIKDLDPNIWAIDTTFAIYNKQDLPTGNIASKLIKFYFWDEAYQRMQRKNVIWSTATSKYNPAYMTDPINFDPANAVDADREMFTGTAIKSLLLESGLFQPEDFDEIDVGSVKLFHNCPVNSTVADNVEELLSCHYGELKRQNNSEKQFGDLCIFDKDRYTNKFSLTPINKIFEKAGYEADNPLEYQIEHFYINDLIFKDNMISIPKSPVKITPEDSKLDTTKDVTTVPITNFQYDDMAAFDNVKNVVSTPVHTYYPKTKTFMIYQEPSNVNNLETSLKDMYIKQKVLTDGSNPVLLTLNKEKIDADISNHIFIIRPDLGLATKNGLGRLLYSSLFLNQCMVFDVEGSTIRRSARFIGIDRNNLTDNAYDYKFCGQWFLTKVQHIFQNDMYINQVTCVKAHSFKDLKIRKV